MILVMLFSFSASSMYSEVFLGCSLCPGTRCNLGPCVGLKGQCDDGIYHKCEWRIFADEKRVGIRNECPISHLAVMVTSCRLLR